MKRVTIVLYPHHPIACEGNDDPAPLRTITLAARASAKIKERAERLAAKIARKYACYVQVWDIS